MEKNVGTLERWNVRMLRLGKNGGAQSRLMGVLGGGGVRVVLGVAQAEVALVAGPAAVRVYMEQVVQQKFERSFSSGPADGRASTTGTIGGFSEEKHGPLLSVWPGRGVYTCYGTLERLNV